MTIKELIAEETGKHIFCHKQGAFWVCYEQSAYLACFSRAYTPVKKFIKNCNQEVVSVGFPNSALEQWTDENTIETIEKSERIIALQYVGHLFRLSFYKTSELQNNETNKQLNNEKTIHFTCYFIHICHNGTVGRD